MTRLGKQGWAVALAGLFLTQGGCLGPTPFSPTPLAKPLPGGTAKSEELPTDQAVRASLAMAQNQEKGQNEVGAIEQYENVLRLDPHNLQASRRLAVLYDNCCQFSKADEQYRILVKALPRDATVFNDWGYSYFLRNHWDDSEKCLRHALELDPNNREARCNLGKTLGQMGRYDEARKAFQQANLTEAEVHAAMAFVYLTCGDKSKDVLAEARSECQLACQIDPFCAKARQLMDKLDGTGQPPAERIAATGTGTGRQGTCPPCIPGRTPVAHLGGPALEPANGTASEKPNPVYVSPKGTAWVPVSHEAQSEVAPPPPLPDSAKKGEPGTVTFE
jgi:Tfp pilus assembly protein PilF